MIWLTWRQARTQTLAALAALAALAIYLLVLRLAIQNAYDTTIVGCQPGEGCSIAKEQFNETYGAQIGLIGALLIGVPAAIGIFWGAPLITRELETGTHRLVWNQSVTRTRWLAVKLGIIALIAVAVTGLFSVLLSWAAEPFDRVIGSRFSSLTFDSRDLVPLGYAVFAFVLGTTVGLLVRRTLPAMAITLAAFAVVQIVMPMAIRPHLMTPVTASVALTPEVSESINGLGSDSRTGGDAAPMKINGYSKPGAWMLTSLSPLLKADGSAFTMGDMKACFSGDFASDKNCLTEQNLSFVATYHPAGRYWPFQWIETLIFLTLALVLAGFCFWRIQRVAG
jgi:ABC-type transport system involved in multi-copper enzyme maturation permease subunit